MHTSYCTLLPLLLQHSQLHSCIAQDQNYSLLLLLLPLILAAAATHLGSLSIFQAALLLARLLMACLISLRVTAVSSSRQLFQQALTSCCSTSG
jgi:hypothetical protein